MFICELVRIILDDVLLFVWVFFSQKSFDRVSVYSFCYFNFFFFSKYKIMFICELVRIILGIVSLFVWGVLGFFLTKVF